MRYSPLEVEATVRVAARAVLFEPPATRTLQISVANTSYCGLTLSAPNLSVSRTSLLTHMPTQTSKNISSQVLKADSRYCKWVRLSEPRTPSV